MKITELNLQDFTWDRPPRGNVNRESGNVICFTCRQRVTADLRCGCSVLQLEQMLDHEYEMRMADEGNPNF